MHGGGLLLFIKHSIKINNAILGDFEVFAYIATCMAFYSTYNHDLIHVSNSVLMFMHDSSVSCEIQVY